MRGRQPIFDTSTKVFKEPFILVLQRNDEFGYKSAYENVKHL